MASPPQEGFLQATANLQEQLDTMEANIRRDIASLESQIITQRAALDDVQRDRESVRRTLQLLTGKPSEPAAPEAPPVEAPAARVEDVGLMEPTTEPPGLLSDEEIQTVLDEPVAPDAPIVPVQRTLRRRGEQIGPISDNAELVLALLSEHPGERMTVGTMRKLLNDKLGTSAIYHVLEHELIGLETDAGKVYREGVDWYFETPETRKTDAAKKERAAASSKPKRQDDGRERRNAGAQKQVDAAEAKKKVVLEKLTEVGISNGTHMVALTGIKTAGQYLAEAAKDGLVCRTEAKQGPGVYFWDKEYTGELSVTAARGGERFGQWAVKVTRDDVVGWIEKNAPNRAFESREVRAAFPKSGRSPVDKMLRTLLDENYLVKPKLGFFHKAGLTGLDIPKREAYGAAREQADKKAAKGGKEGDDESPSELDGGWLAVVAGRIQGKGAGQYSPAQIAAADPGRHWGQLDAELVGRAMTQLAEQGDLIDIGMSDLPLFKYEGTPSNGGAKAARAAKRANIEEANKQPARGAPVEGTGKGLVVSHPGVRAFVAKIISAGGTVTRANNSHFEVRNPAIPKKKTLISSTPRTDRTIENERLKVRRLLNLAV